MQRPYREAAVTQFSLPKHPAEGTPGRELLFLLCGVTCWLGRYPCVQQSLQGETIYVLYRNVAFAVGDFWESFGLAMAAVDSTWPVSVYGTAPNQETVKLTARKDKKSIRLVQYSISGKSAETLGTLCVQIDCADRAAAGPLARLLSAMNWQNNLAALRWSDGAFLREQNLIAGPKDRGFFCYAGLDTDATRSDFLFSLDFAAKLSLWSAFLAEGLEPLEFEWLGLEISEKSIINRMEWELALGEALDHLNFRVVNEDKSFALFDGTGNRRYFGADCRQAAERVLLKILFPLNYQ